MKRGTARSLLIALMFSLALVPLQARDFSDRLTLIEDRSSPQPEPVAPEERVPELPTIDGLGRAITVEQVATMAIPPELIRREALELVIDFLDLRPDQVETLLVLMAERYAIVMPLIRDIVERERQIWLLLDGQPDPELIGRLVLEIRDLYALIAEAQVEFLMAFEAILDPAQRERFGAMRLAAQLRPLLPAFGVLGLI